MKQFLIAVGIGLVMVVAFYWKNLTVPAVNYNRWVGTNDLTDYNYPYRDFMNKSYQKGQIPMWVSGLSSGYPVMGEGPGFVYPLNILWSGFSTITSTNLTIISSYWLLFIFSWLYLHQIKMSFGAAIVGAMLVTFSGFAVNELLHWGILVSLYLFMGELWLFERKNVLGMGILFGLALLGGHPQITLYSLVFLLAYSVFFWFSRGGGVGKFVLGILIFVILGVGIGAAQWIPQAEFTMQSTRSRGLSDQMIDRYAFPINQLVTFINPWVAFSNAHTFEAFLQNGWPTDERYVYMGILGLVLGLTGIVLIPKLGMRAVYFVLAAVLALLLSFGTSFTTGFILKIPPFSFFRIPFKMMFMVDIGLAVLTAMVINYFSSKLKWGVIIIVLIIFGDVYFNAKKLYPEVDARVWYKTPAVVDFLKANLRDNERVTNGQYFYSTLQLFLERPDIYGKPEGFVNLRNLLPNYNNLIYGIPENVGAANGAGLKIQRYNDLETELYYKGMDFKAPNKVEVTDGYLFLNRLMGVRYILLTQDLSTYVTAKVKEFPFETGQDSVKVYEFTDYYPRAMMAPKAEKASPEEIKKHLLAADFDPKQKVFIEKDSDWGARGGYAATVKFVSYEDTKIELESQASGDGWLFLSDTYYPGWEAYVDDKETEIYLANYAFRAVQVPEGNHKIVFKYEPESVKWGIGISLTMGLVIIVFLLIKLIFNFQAPNNFLKNKFSK